jgi:hypothetical protein
LGEIQLDEFALDGHPAPLLRRHDQILDAPEVDA